MERGPHRAYPGARARARVAGSDARGSIEFNLGVAYYNLGDADHSLSHLLAGLPVARAAGLRRSEAELLVALGGAYIWAAHERVLALIYYTAAALLGKRFARHVIGRDVIELGNGAQRVRRGSGPWHQTLLSEIQEIQGRG